MALYSSPRRDLQLGLFLCLGSCLLRFTLAGGLCPVWFTGMFFRFNSMHFIWFKKEKEKDWAAAFPYLTTSFCMESIAVVPRLLIWHHQLQQQGSSQSQILSISSVQHSGILANLRFPHPSFHSNSVARVVHPKTNNLILFMPLRLFHRPQPMPVWDVIQQWSKGIDRYPPPSSTEDWGYTVSSH
jgi:hypothetical protein